MKEYNYMQKWLMNLKISKKIITGFLVVLAMSIVVDTVGILGVLNISNNSASLYKESTLGLQYAGDAAVVFMQINFSRMSQLSTADQESGADKTDYFIQMDDLLTNCYNTIQDPKATALLDKIQEEWNTFKTKWQDKAVLNREGVAIDQSMVSLRNMLCDDFLTLIEEITQSASVSADSNVGNGRNSAIAMLVVMIVAIVISLLT